MAEKSDLKDDMPELGFLPKRAEEMWGKQNLPRNDHSMLFV